MVDYKEIAKQTRKDTLSLIHKGQTSHIASCFSLTDIAVVLYENLKENDIVIWSKGWAAALFYVLEIRRGTLDRETVFNTFPDAPYLGLLERSVPGVVTSGGSVGHGLNVAVGIALAKKRADEAGRVYVLMSDGELNEGSTWEAILFAAHHKLDNLVAIVDKNGWQAMGRSEEVLDLGDLERKFKSFGLTDTWTVDGHDYAQIEYEVRHHLSKEYFEPTPKMIIANTVKGKGVSFMENHLTYHYKHVDDETYAKAMEELS